MNLILGGSGNLGEYLLHELGRDSGTITFGRSEPKTPRDNIHIAGDIMETSEYLEALDKIFATYDIQRIVYNSAYTEHATVLPEITSATVGRIFGINFYGYFFLLKKIESLPISYGRLRVVYISSNSMRTLNASSPIYIASKSASETLSLATAKRLANRVAINVVRPGLMYSAMTKERFDSIKQKVLNSTPMEKLVSPHDVAKTVLKVLEDDMMIGQTLTIDGGRTI